MTRFVIDAGVGLLIASGEVTVHASHELLAPTLFRSQVMSLARSRVNRGELSTEIALERLERLWKMPIRLLGDAVLRRLAWAISDQMGWDGTYDAEYIALTQLQADAFVTLDNDLATAIQPLVTVATIVDLERH